MADILEEYYKIPIVTRVYATACVLTTAACTLDLVSPFSLYFSFKLVFRDLEVWRLVTNFFFFGSHFSLDFVFHMFYLIRYSAALEDGSFRDRNADFFYMLLFGAVCMLFMSPYVNVYFLGHSLSFMMIYVWSRRNQFSHMNILGLFTFRAPFLPWVLLAFSALLGADLTVDVMGIIVGHLYFYLEDVYPQMTESRLRILKTPRFIEMLFMGNAYEEDRVPDGFELDEDIAVPEEPEYVDDIPETDEQGLHEE